MVEAPRLQLELYVIFALVKLLPLFLRRFLVDVCLLFVVFVVSSSVSSLSLTCTVYAIDSFVVQLFPVGFMVLIQLSICGLLTLLLVLVLVSVLLFGVGSGVADGGACFGWCCCRTLLHFNDLLLLLCSRLFSVCL
jgi:hypothetical protein